MKVVVDHDTITVSFSIIIPTEIPSFRIRPTFVETRRVYDYATIKSHNNNVQAKNMYFAKRHMNQYNRARANVKFAKHSFQKTQGK